MGSILVACPEFQNFKMSRERMIMIHMDLCTYVLIHQIFFEISLRIGDLNLGLYPSFSQEVP